MKNEIFQTLLDYLGHSDTSVKFCGSGTSAKLFADFFLNGRSIITDAPDMVVIHDNTAILIEHFEFDSFQVGRKGSKNRQEQFRINKREESLESAILETHFLDRINGRSSYKDYLKNIERNFIEHYNRINIYKSNLIASGIIDNSMETKMMFLIEDTSPMGSMVADDSEVHPIVLACCKEFLDLFKGSIDLDYVLSCSSAADNQFIWFIDRNDISEYYFNVEDYNKMQFIPSTPVVSCSKIFIPCPTSKKNI